MVVELKVLEEEYIPPVVKFRDKQIKELKFYFNLITSLTKSATKNNVLLYGPHGTGKTLSVKYILSKLPEPQRNQIVLSLAAETTYKTLSVLGREIQLTIPDKGLSSEDVLERIQDEIEKKKIKMVIIDEIDKIADEHLNMILYYFSRKGIVSLIGISNSLLFKQKITDPRVISSYHPSEIFFQPYSSSQVEEILRDRCKECGASGMLHNDTIAYMAGMCVQRGADVRYALHWLRSALINALMNNINSVSKEMALKTLSKVDDEFIFTSIAQLRRPQILILHVLLQQKQIPISKLYTEYNRINNDNGMSTLSNTRLRELTSELSVLGLVKTTIRGKGRGKGTEWILTLSEDLDRQRIGGKVDPLIKEIYGRLPYQKEVLPLDRYSPGGNE